MKNYVKILILLVAPCLSFAQPKVVVSIEPVQAIVGALMQDVAEPTLLLPPGASPHSYALKPSQVKNLHAADLVVWVGPELENFLSRPLGQIQPEKIFTLLESEQLILYPYRDAHAHDHGHQHDDIDPHFWLDPLNMKIMADILAEQLGRLDPEHQARYLSNAALVKGQLDELNVDLTKKLKPVKNRGFIVFHDAYQYFEKRYHLKSAGSLTINPDIMPSAAQILVIKRTIKDQKVSCILSEPQFSPAMVRRIAEETGSNYATIDPINGPEGAKFNAYAALMQQLADTLLGCLTGEVK